MSSFPPKYVIYAKFEVEGLVEKTDVIGAVFGQTEGLFGPDMDLHELQKGGRIGRIEIELESKEGKTVGVITIPSSLDRPTTALLAAAVESVERIGPYACKIVLDKIVDTREEKRKLVTERAKEILRKWTVETKTEVGELVKDVGEVARQPEVIVYGKESLPAGPEVETAGSIIIVEGRADVAHLLKYGYNNVIALEGARVPETIVKLSKEREVTAFLDGDRSADLILKELLRSVSVDFVARAPEGKEVEELSPKEIIKALRERIPVEQLSREFRATRARAVSVPVTVPKPIYDAAIELKETFEALLFNEAMERMERIPVSELVDKLQSVEGVHTIVFDGIVTERLLGVAVKKGVKRIVADRISRTIRPPYPIELLTFSTIKSE